MGPAPSTISSWSSRGSRRWSCSPSRSDSRWGTRELGGWGSSQAWQVRSGIGLVAAASGALNQLIERRTDALMARTANRPLPTGRLTPIEVAGFGLPLRGRRALPCCSLEVNWHDGPFGILTSVLYVAAYTPLKRYTALSTAIGAIPGALPPVLGWTASGARLAGRRFRFLPPVCLAVSPFSGDRVALPGRLRVGRPADAARRNSAPRRDGFSASVYAAVLVPVSLLPGQVPWPADRTGWRPCFWGWVTWRPPCGFSPMNRGRRPGACCILRSFTSRSALGPHLGPSPPVELRFSNMSSHAPAHPTALSPSAQDGTSHSQLETGNVALPRHGDHVFHGLHRHVHRAPPGLGRLAFESRGDAPPHRGRRNSTRSSCWPRVISWSWPTRRSPAAKFKRSSRYLHREHSPWRASFLGIKGYEYYGKWEHDILPGHIAEDDSQSMTKLVADFERRSQGISPAMCPPPKPRDWPTSGW